jgi:hypothetical protein
MNRREFLSGLLAASAAAVAARLPLVGDDTAAQRAIEEASGPETVSAWLRTTSGETTLQFGGMEMRVTPTWQRFSFTCQTGRAEESASSLWSQARASGGDIESFGWTVTQPVPVSTMR